MKKNKAFKLIITYFSLGDATISPACSETEKEALKTQATALKESTAALDTIISGAGVFLDCL
jgi:hypothetical protein